jgi:hypothetical protein
VSQTLLAQGAGVSSARGPCPGRSGARHESSSAKRRSCSRQTVPFERPLWMNRRSIGRRSPKTTGRPRVDWPCHRRPAFPSALGFSGGSSGRPEPLTCDATQESRSWRRKAPPFAHRAAKAAPSTLAVRSDAVRDRSDHTAKAGGDSCSERRRQATCRPLERRCRRALDSEPRPAWNGR